MRIDPAASSLVMSSPSMPENQAPAAAPPQQPSSAAADHAPAPSAGWQSPQHEVNVVLGENQQMVYKFVEKSTGEVVVQIPPEESLRLIQNIQQLLKRSEQRFKVRG